MTSADAFSRRSRRVACRADSELWQIELVTRGA
jgi:hypothetical protein